MSAPFILAPSEQHAGAPPLERPFFRFASGQTDGLLALAEVRLPPLTAGPNLHVHANEDEMFFVLDGVMTVQVGDQLHEIAAGGLAWGARGTPFRRCRRRRSYSPRQCCGLRVGCLPDAAPLSCWRTCIGRTVKRSPCCSTWPTMSPGSLWQLC